MVSGVKHFARSDNSVPTLESLKITAIAGAFPLTAPFYCVSANPIFFA
jgi:hypothetical protein